MSTKYVLITGGLGYIGRQLVYYLLDKTNFNLIIIDNLSIHPINHKFVGYESRIKILNQNYIYLIDCLHELMENNKCITVEYAFHLAAYSFINEDLTVRHKYKEDVIGTYNFLDLLNILQCKNLIFASTSAVYGDISKELSQDNLYSSVEDSGLKPAATYGNTKLQIEYILKNECPVHKINYGIVRLFNVVGADSLGRTGEYTSEHIITKLLEHDITKPFKVFGSDYNTPDGTCIRNYIHVEDVVDAIYKIVVYISENNVSNIFNVCSNTQASVLEIFNCVNKQCFESECEIEFADRRPGDVDAIIGNNNKIKNIIDWTPTEKSNLDYIIKSAYDWFINLE